MPGSTLGAESGSTLGAESGFGVAAGGSVGGSDADIASVNAADADTAVRNCRDCRRSARTCLFSDGDLGDIGGVRATCGVCTIPSESGSVGNSLSELIACLCGRSECG